MKFQISNFKFRISKSGRKTNSQFAIRNSQFARAFTLIEIMVAVAIFTLLVAAVYTTWVLIMRAKQVGNEAAAQVQRQRIAIRTIEDSLTCIQSFQASMKYYTFAVTNGDQPTLSFVARVPDVFPRNGRFGDFNLRRLTFTLEPATTGVSAAKENDLVLRQNPMLMDMDPDEQASPLVLAHNVNGFVIECWDTNKLDWVDEWDDTNSIPPMVRIKLTLGGKTTDTRPATPLSITREIAMPSSTMPRIVQTGSPLNGAGGAVGGIGAGNRGAPNNPSLPSVPGDSRGRGGGDLQ
jgi:prepilin-type N-terminal cleavage/methylation domain-containing protein